jgi:hypothetical protein
MKVSELIEQLQFLDADADVHFSYNYGDHWRTEVCPAASRVEEGQVVFSDYHRMDKIYEADYDDNDEEVEGQGARRVVVIS